MAHVTVIPAQPEQQEILRVAAYCRVSSDSNDQLHSYAAQIRAYTELIGSHEGWDLVDVYADEGLTGTRMDKRDDFNRMLADCRKGKIDKVIVKSISRFARNTRDCLAALRELFRLGVAVQFEKENIDTQTLTTELMVSVSASLAQQESISISQNQRQSYRRRMERGLFITCKAPYGYRLTEDGKNLEIVPEEAEQVRWIFDQYLSGRSAAWIAEQMTRKNIPTTDRKPYWQTTTVLYLLSNEKYVGDALCQKTFAHGFPFVKRLNKGEKMQYYVEGSHPAIISHEVFERAKELRRRKAQRAASERQEYPLTQKLVCGACGATFVRRKNKGSGLNVWVCRRHDDKADSCPTGRIREDAVYRAFVRMYNRLKQNESAIFQPALSQLDALIDTAHRDNPAILEINQAIAQNTEQNYKINLLQSKGLLDEETCAARRNMINAKLNQLRVKRRRLLENDDIDEAAEVLRRTASLIQKGPDALESFDETLFDELVEEIIVDTRTQIRFRLKGGIELRESLEVGL